MAACNAGERERPKVKLGSGDTDYMQTSKERGKSEQDMFISPFSYFHTLLLPHSITSTLWYFHNGYISLPSHSVPSPA